MCRGYNQNRREIDEWELFEMCRGTLFLVFGLLGCYWGGPARADQGSGDARQASDARIAGLIEQLGAKSYTARRRACASCSASAPGQNRSFGLPQPSRR